MLSLSGCFGTTWPIVSQKSHLLLLVSYGTRVQFVSGCSHTTTKHSTFSPPPPRGGLHPAGSERIHGGEHGGSQATGKHFKEACHINKSLTTLGRVIMELVEAQRTGGRGSAGGSGVSKGMSSANKTRHVPYRDSRLTFLLQDSLGGNAKTLMIANISPSSVSAQETLSTLQFMSRAKCIRNRATINLDARGDVVLLQREIVRLNTELDNLRKGYTEPAVQENKELRIKLEE